MHAHIVGSGLAGLAAAVYLVRDGGMSGSDITIYEAGNGLGGAMGIAGGPSSGYILPTGRIFEAEYRCTLDLLSHIPAASDPGISVKDEILDFNARHGFRDTAHIIDRDGKVVRSSHYGLSVRDRLDLVLLALTPEAMLEGRRIEAHFGEAFFRTEFWLLWTTIMGCLPQHSALEMRRFLNRFLHLLPTLSDMTMMYRTRYNQYDAIAEPLVRWLRERDVRFLAGAWVHAIGFTPSAAEFSATSLAYERDGTATQVTIAPKDIVLVTNGSQVADLSVGSMTEPPRARSDGRSWALWESLAAGRSGFGNPAAFFGARHVPDTQWLSFTVTTVETRFFALMTKLTGEEPGRGGLLTLRDSNWLITLTIFHQPELIGQPAGTRVWWGYALYPDRPGNWVAKPALACSGAEILQETLHHLGFGHETDAIMAGSTCVPCLLPYAGSVWLPRGHADRPRVVPAGSTNIGFIGQFAEMPLETVFTMEYSVRSARMAVATLLGLDVELPSVYQGQFDPHALYGALKALA